MSHDVDTILRGPKGYSWARKAIEAMEAHNVWPTATNFELWLHYVAIKDSEVATQISSLIKSGTPFTDKVGEELAAQHLPGAKLSGEILTAGKSLSNELDSVSKAIESARETSEAYDQQLATASESLEAQDTDAVRGMISDLTSATRKVREENQALENRLADTTAELSRLRAHLEQVRREAMTDSLTGLANRKAFDECIEQACAQRGTPTTLAVIDIDHFKKFNDTWGHQTGDQVIRYVASVISRIASLPPRLAARYGGEEFALVFPGEKPEAIMVALEAAREEIASRVLKRRSTNEDLGAITISTGVAECLPGEPSTAFIERADGALYASKHNGRNRTTLAGKSAEHRAA